MQIHVLHTGTMHSQFNSKREPKLFAIATAVEVCHGNNPERNNPEQINFDQTKMRTHLIECFNKGKLTLFPKSTSETLPRPMRKSKKVVTVGCHRAMMN